MTTTAAAGSHQLVVTAQLHDLAVLHHGHPVGSRTVEIAPGQTRRLTYTVNGTPVKDSTCSDQPIVPLLQRKFRLFRPVALPRPLPCDSVRLNAPASLI